LNVHCSLVELACSRYAPCAAPSLRSIAVASASQAFRSTHAFWLDNPYIPFLRLCGITRAFSLWKEVCSALRFLDAKVCTRTHAHTFTNTYTLTHTTHTLTQTHPPSLLSKYVCADESLRQRVS
jgi:hypothetical protein